MNHINVESELSLNSVKDLLFKEIKKYLWTSSILSSRRSK